MSRPFDNKRWYRNKEKKEESHIPKRELKKHEIRNLYGDITQSQYFDRYGNPNDLKFKWD